MNRKDFLWTLAGGAAAISLSRCAPADEGAAGGTGATGVAAGGDTGTGTGAIELQAATQAWFREARFGMFIHWGIYSLLGKGEWVMQNERMTIDEYEPLAARFNPTGYDPAEWVRTAKDAGMRYITITSKHHDGFAMWDSEVSPYNIVDATPYGRDVLRMLADECERQDLRLFFYHSHLDWHHPDYFPRGKTGQYSGRPESGEFNAYLDYMDAQVAELAGGDYGELAGFWFDGWWDQHLDEQDKSDTRTHVDWRLQQTYDLIHRLQPQAIIGNNHHVTPFPGEGFQTVEKDLPGRNTAGFNTTVVSDLPLETCDTMNRSWGYNAGDHDWKSSTELIHYLVRAAGHDTNLLLNVGPTPEGTFQPEVTERLADVGAWTSRYGETVYGTRGGPMPPQEWGVMTSKPEQIFVHVLAPGAAERIALPGTAELNVTGARRLGTDDPVSIEKPGDVELQLGQAGRDPVDTIVVLETA
jgi:alpha-L-fucosidase